MRLPILLSPAAVKQWADEIVRTLEGALSRIEQTKHTRGAIVPLPSYAVADLPAASANTARMVYVSNETGGAVPAFSDGTNWRRVTDRAVVS